ncbi:MAG: sel1 repeat family protein [Rhodospirillaceae bacterium]|nr:sel1 repeat family protein [Rhodospirillaceae bacterium]
MRHSWTFGRIAAALFAAGLLAPAGTPPARAGVAEGIAAYKAQDYATALRAFRAEAERGVAEAQFYLGWMYDNATGVEHDDAEAARWYRHAAEQGYAPAQHYLGLLYADGEGVGQDLAQAETWFHRAALQGNPGAQYALGVMYRDGVVVEKDPVEALKWLTLSTAAGGPEESDAEEARDDLARSLTPEQQAEAERRVRDWHPVPERPARP